MIMKSLVIRFSEQVSKFETTHQRLKDIAEYLGVSQNKAVAYAINEAWKNLAKNEDMLEELEFKRHGRNGGGVTYLHADGVPLSHEDDSIENDLLFRFLSKEQKEAIRSAPSLEEKRRLKAKFLKETAPDVAADNFKSS